MEVIMLDFNQIESDTKTGDFELIPDKTIAYAVMQLQGGDTEIPEFGRGNFFLKSQHSKAKWLPLEFTIIGGDYDGRKVWHRLFVDGDKLNAYLTPELSSAITSLNSEPLAVITGFDIASRQA